MALMWGRAKNAESYTETLVEAVLTGMVNQMEEDKNIQVGVVEVGYNIDPEPDFSCEELTEYIDEISGALLSPKLVKLARDEEIKFIHD